MFRSFHLFAIKSTIRVVLYYFICSNANFAKIGYGISSYMGYRSGAAEGASPGGGHMAGVLLVRAVPSGQWSRVLIGAEHGAMLIHATLHSGRTRRH